MPHAISRTLVLAAVVSFLTPLIRAQSAPDTKEPAMDTAAVAADLYQKLAPQSQGNLFFSPTSIETALAMTYAGAKNATAGQMAKTLHFSGNQTQTAAAFAKLLDTLNHPPEVLVSFDHDKPVNAPAYQLVIANALWGQKNYPFDPAFSKLVEDNFGAALSNLDFQQPDQARQTINFWVAKKTKDKIKDLLAKGSVGPFTRLVLTNAIYFKSNWQTPFQKSATEKAPFHRTARDSAEVPFMHQQHSFAYTENDDFQALELPYKNHTLSMVILLPRKTDGLAAVEKSLAPDNLKQWLAALKTVPVKVALPKFTVTAAFSLADTFKTLGMPDAFDPNKADFTGMTAPPRHERLFISAVIHKAYVSVDEEGTEAAAATAVAMAAAAMPLAPAQPKIFTADHPFIFLIRHNSTGEILFLGRLVDCR